MAEKFQIYNEQLQLLGKSGAPLFNVHSIFTLQEGVVNNVSKILNPLPWARSERDNKIVGLQISNDPSILEVARSEVHSEQAEWLWHLASHLWIYSDDGRILVQKRGSGKDVYPNRYDASAAGHIDQIKDSSTAATIVREAGEEIGFKTDIDSLQFLGVEKYAMQIPSENEGGESQKNYEHKFVYLQGLPSGSLERDENNLYVGETFKLSEGDQSDQFEKLEKAIRKEIEKLGQKQGRELTSEEKEIIKTRMEEKILAPEVAGLMVFTIDELEKDIQENPDNYVPRLDYWKDIIKEIRAQIAQKTEQK